MSMKTIAHNKHGDDVLKLFGPSSIGSPRGLGGLRPPGSLRAARPGREGRCHPDHLLGPAALGLQRLQAGRRGLGLHEGDHVLPALHGPRRQHEAREGKLAKDLRYHQHEHGDRITIFYASPEAWSKRYRDKLVDDGQGGKVKFLTQIKDAVGHLFGAEPFLWMANKDLGDTFFPQPGAEKLPNTPHGLNSYQGLPQRGGALGLNPPPQHFHFMESYSIDGDEVRAAHYKSAVYQAVVRCSIRNPKDETPKRVVVMDQDTAQWLADLFPGARVEPLPGLNGVPSKGKAGSAPQARQ
jgi:hypothetical protein